MAYEEQDAIRYIRSKTGFSADRYDDDQLLNIIDIIWDWQEANGYLEIDADDEDDEIDIDDLTAHAIHLLRKDRGNIVAEDDVRPIIEAELEFEETV